MNSFPLASTGSRDLISSIPVEGMDVCWAGPTLGNRAFCFGSEDGRLLITDYQGVPFDRAYKVNQSGEAVNGVAFLDRRFAVSTRNEIMVFTLPPKQRGESRVAPIPFGAHDVITGVSGHFFAPIGRAGLMSCLPTEGESQEITVSGGPEGEVYFYRVISLRAIGGEEVLACATRSGGIASLEFRAAESQRTVSTLTFGGLDVIDVCPLLPGQPSTAAAALGKDGTLILFRDVLHEKTPTTVKYGAIKGVAYRLLCVRGSLFLLTSEGIHVITGLVDGVLTGKTKDPVTPVLVVPMEAVDASAVGEQWILIVMPDGILRLDVELLQAYKPVNLRVGERRDIVLGEIREELPVFINPPWKSGTIEQTASVYAGAGA